MIIDERKSELNQIVASIHDNVTEQDDPEQPELNKDEDLKKSFWEIYIFKLLSQKEIFDEQS